MLNDNLKFSLRSIVEKNKLNGTNFLDWERNLRIILRSEGREDVLATLIPIVTDTSSDEEKATTNQVRSEALPVTCIMLAAMKPDLQKRFEHSDAYTIITELKTLFQDQTRIERDGLSPHMKLSRTLIVYLKLTPFQFLMIWVLDYLI